MLRAKKEITQNTVLADTVMEDLQKDVQGFKAIAEILKSQTGIQLVENEKNLFLMAGRLNKVLRKLEISEYKDYIALLKSGDPSYLGDLVSAMTTNTTQFFREDEHFELLKTVVKDVMTRKGADKDLRIWVSASSTGQEAYTIAMVLDEARTSLPQFNLKLLSTDIDPEVLRKASQGIYSQNEINSAPPHYRQKYFEALPKSDPKMYQISSRLRESVRFAQLNLLADAYPFKFPFDIIFCRNVLIYFDRPTSEVIISKFSKALSKDAYLFLGHSETGMMKNPTFKPAGGALYQRKI